MQKKDWLKFKSFTHLTPKIPFAQQGWVRNYVESPKNIESHRFFPLLHYTKVDKKYQRYRINGIKSEERKSKSKKREIFYNNHLDGHIFSYYADLLSTKLNSKYIVDEMLMDSVIAYRSIPFNQYRNKCNIDFANEVFTYIKESEKTELSAICLDVSNYFPSLNHRLLKRMWCQVLNRFDLPLDHYKVFKAITKFSYIEIGDIFKDKPELGIKKLSFLKNREIDSFYESGDEFNNSIVAKGLIRVNKSRCGIPQGSSISAVLSNLYLLNFDRLMVKLARTYKGLYRRYSDDIVFICSPKWIDKVNTTVKNFLTNDLLLEIQDRKTQRVDFARQSISHEWNTTLNEEGVKYKGRPLTYLGFDFDGKKIRLKNKSVSGYYRKTKRIIRRAGLFANRTRNFGNLLGPQRGDPWIYKSRIYRLKTHLGSKKKKIENKVYWGNYLSYVYNASKIMNEPGIKKQLKNHWRIVEREIDFYNRKYDLPLAPRRKKKRKTNTR